MTDFLKKFYRYIDSHFIGFVRLWMLLLIPCAISRHFAAWMVTANIAMWLLIMCGNRKGWETMTDTCICCGEIVPEGRMVCPNCENGGENNEQRN